jgi:hypothetical protein
VRRVGKTTLDDAEFLNCDLPSSQRFLADPEGQKYCKHTLAAWHQPHYAFNGVSPDEMRRRDPVHILSSEGGGEYAFDLAK